MKKKQTIKYKGCETCSNCIPIGEGDHVCNECGEPVIVISDYAPADDYLKCGGMKYAP